MTLKRMDHELAEAIPTLVERGVLDSPRGAMLLRGARRERLSVALELKLLLYLGVALVTTGVGLRLAQAPLELATLGVALAIAGGAVAAYVWVARHAPAFSWRSTPSPNLAFDYILLLAALLTVALGAWLEVRIGFLGGWRHHLLGAAALYLALALRHDSRVLFGLALSSLAAWRGMSLSALAHLEAPTIGPALRGNAAVLGLAFVLLGVALRRARRKPHFEPVASEIGTLFVLGALLFGMDEEDRSHWLFASAAFVIGAALAAWARKRRRSRLFAIGIGAAYAGASGIVLRALDDKRLAAAWFALSATVLVIGLLRGRDPGGEELEE